MNYFKGLLTNCYFQMEVDSKLRLESGYLTDLGKRKSKLPSEEKWPSSGKCYVTSRSALTRAKPAKK